MLLNELHTTLYHFGCPLARVQLLGKRIRKAIKTDATQCKRRRRPTLSAEHLVKHLTKLALDIYEARGLCFRDANLQARRDAYECSYEHYRNALNAHPVYEYKDDSDEWSTIDDASVHQALHTLFTGASHQVEFRNTRHRYMAQKQSDGRYIQTNIHFSTRRELRVRPLPSEPQMAGYTEDWKTEVLIGQAPRFFSVTEAKELCCTHSFGCGEQQTIVGSRALTNLANVFSSFFSGQDSVR